MNYITVDGCSSQEREEKERKVKKAERDRLKRVFNGHVGAGRLPKHFEPLKVTCVISLAETEFQR